MGAYAHHCDDFEDVSMTYGENLEPQRNPAGGEEPGAGDLGE